jgi:hypothetical protein
MSHGIEITYLTIHSCAGLRGIDLADRVDVESGRGSIEWPHSGDLVIRGY